MPRCKYSRKGNVKERLGKREHDKQGGGVVGGAVRLFFRREGTIKYWKGAVEVRDVTHHYSSRDRAGRRSAGALPASLHLSDREFTESALATAELGILPTILCSLFHIPGSVSGRIQ